MGWGVAWPWLLGTFVGGYLLGSIPFGLVITKVFGLGDLRSIGSGNIGATNVLRTGNKPAALATLILDSGKGAAAVLIALSLFGFTAAQLAGLGAVLGHLFPIWLGFRGGKGVATVLGTVLALGFWAGLATCLTWLFIAAVFRISSLSALVALALSPVWMGVLGAEGAIWLCIVLAVLVWIRHAENIKRLLRGEEPRIGAKKA
ncbi:MAG: glycerol-3-phosphate 1-O-acyltransferase PlsY [Pseudomonadota bacterium]